MALSRHEFSGSRPDNRDIDPCQRELARQHQPRRTSSTITTAWLVIAHPVVPTATNSAARDPHVDNNTRISTAQEKSVHRREAAKRTTTATAMTCGMSFASGPRRRKIIDRAGRGEN